jgi:pimeloyl-ACP methyl ester carboxylesterase
MSPRAAQELPVFVFLSAGVLHRVGPARLHVSLARELARMGFSSLRVDLAGTGDSPPRPGLTNQESVAADCKGIMDVVDSRLGPLPLVLAGLCSGADNAIRLTPQESRVIGMVLLDPYCFPDDGFRVREAVKNYTNPVQYAAWLKRGFNALTTSREEKNNGDKSVDYLAIRDLPTREQMRAAFVSIRERKGRALSVFTQYARPYYNQAGQLDRALDVEGYRQYCTELFWPQAEHTFPLELHRRRLVEEIMAWAGGYIRPRSSAGARTLPQPATVTGS